MNKMYAFCSYFMKSVAGVIQIWVNLVPDYGEVITKSFLLGTPVRPIQQIRSWARLLTFCKWYLQMKILEKKWALLIQITVMFVTRVLIKKKLPLLHAMDWCRTCETLITQFADSWASYQICKIAGCACAGNAGNVFPRRRFQRKPLVSDPGMHHGTCVTHVPWCMPGSLTCGDGENVPGIPGACAPAILCIW